MERRSLTIVVADDWPDTAEIIAQFLAWHGHVIHTAFDGDDAILLVEQHKPAAVVLDIAMPKKSGLEVARWCHRLPAKPLLIAISGRCSKDDVEAAHGAGFQYFFPKPTDLFELLKLIEGHK